MMSPTGMKQIAPYVKFIFIWETFLSNWQFVVLQQSNQVVIWVGIASANSDSYPQLQFAICL